MTARAIPPGGDAGISRQVIRTSSPSTCRAITAINSRSPPGLDLAMGDRILIIDADLQDPPELLSAMMREMDLAGADVVYGLRRSREGETVFKRGTAKLFYRLLSKATDTNIPVDTGDFRLITRRARSTYSWRCRSRRASSAAWSPGWASARCRCLTTATSGSPARPIIRCAR